jgi:Fur family peroxide stress response transcriptional regulator
MDLRPHAHDGERLAAACREAGLKATPQRLAVLKALLTSREHPGPEAVFRQVRGELSSISLATVYKTLDALEAAGLVERVTPLSDGRRYDANRAPHHHLVCTTCGRIEDHEDPALAPPVPSQLGGFQARSVRVEVLGVCAACRREA